MINRVSIRLATLLIAFSLSACSTIHFDRGEPQHSARSSTHSQWHHIALDTFELSDPVKPQAFCGRKGWQSVKTERTFLNGLATSMTPIVAIWWTPQTVEVTCQAG